VAVTYPACPIIKCISRTTDITHDLTEYLKSKDTMKGLYSIPYYALARYLLKAFRCTGFLIEGNRLLKLSESSLVHYWVIRYNESVI
jgi:hypothetical protein